MAWQSHGGIIAWQGVKTSSKGSASRGDPWIGETGDLFRDRDDWPDHGDACAFVNWNAVGIDQKARRKPERALIRYTTRNCFWTKPDVRVIPHDLTLDRWCGWPRIGRQKVVETRGVYRHRFISLPENIRQACLAEKQVCRCNCQMSVHRIERDVLPSNDGTLI